MASLVSFLGEAVAKQVLAISGRFRRVPFLVSKEVLRHSRLWAKFLLLSPWLVGFRRRVSTGWERHCRLLGLDQTQSGLRLEGFR